MWRGVATAIPWATVAKGASPSLTSTLGSTLLIPGIVGIRHCTTRNGGGLGTLSIIPRESNERTNQLILMGSLHHRWSSSATGVNKSSKSHGTRKNLGEDAGRRKVSSGTDPVRSALSCSSCPGEPTDPYRLIGSREVVGHGTNGSPSYIDNIHFPYPAIRFREITPAYKALKEKERGDWKALTLLEKKCLYRISFCQTVEDFMAPTGEWKSILGWAFFWLGIGLLFHLLQIRFFYYEQLPITFEEERQKEQFRRMRDLGIGRIEGINQYYEYQTGPEGGGKC